MAITYYAILECEGRVPSGSSLFKTRDGLDDRKVTRRFLGALAAMKSDGKLSHSKASRGMTLVELLVVIGIILLAVVMFVPRLKPAMDKSRIRESARAIQLYLSSARTQAMVTGRSCGVIIEPLPSETGCAATLSQVETPAPYGGDTIGAMATVTNGGTLNNNGVLLASCSINLVPPLSSVPIHVGDLVQLGYQGFLLNVVSPPGHSSQMVYPAPVTSCYANVDISHGERPAWMSQQPGVSGPHMPYKIWRWPVKTAAAKLQLPAPTVIDLTCSGNDPTGSSASATWPIQSPVPAPPTLPTPVIIMFASDGRIDWVSNAANPGGQQVTTPVYLLVGMRNKVQDPAYSNSNTVLAFSDANADLNDFQSLWISIDAATGLVLVTDMAALPPNPVSVQVSDFWNSRAFARQAMANGGGK